MQTRIEELVEKITEANEAYRLGSAIISDREYDDVVDELTQLDPNNPVLKKIGINIPDNSERKEKLPVPMNSLNKVKTVSEIAQWLKTKFLNENPANIDLCLTPKFDGLSLLSECGTYNAWTRGNGIEGQKSNQHFDIIENGFIVKSGVQGTNGYIVGEVMILKNVFKDKYSMKFKNPRNTVSGVMNSDFCGDIIPLLKDCSYVKYGLISDNKLNKNEQLDVLNRLYNKKFQVPYKIVRIQDLSEEMLYALFQEWSVEYEIDGIVIDINDKDLRAQCKSETSTGNPGFARAYKGDFEERKVTKVKNIRWELSKLGYLIPVAELEPVELDGVTVINAAVNNAKQVVDMNIGVNSVVEIKRSGMVIPYIIRVVSSAVSIGKKDLPTNCPSCNSQLVWNKTQTHLCCVNENCREQKVKQIISFFDILEVDGMREATSRLIFDCGFDTIQKILEMKLEDFRSLPNFGDTKAESIYNNIKAKIQNVELSKLQHATGIFLGLGSKKLKLLEHFKSKPTVEEVKNIAGFSDISAEEYVNKYDEFWNWYKTVENYTTIEQVNLTKEGKMNGKLEGKSFCITGTLSQPRKHFEALIVENGGVCKSMGKTLSYLIAGEDCGSKLSKAEAFGIPIIDEEKFMDMIK